MIRGSTRIRGSYGSPRVTPSCGSAWASEVNRKRVERLMRQAGIQGIYRRSGRKNLVNPATEEDLVTGSSPGGRAGPAVADRHHRAPDRRRQAVLRSGDGRFLPAHHRLVNRTARTPSLVVNALAMAVAGGSPEKNNRLHSDHGTQ